MDKEIDFKNLPRRRTHKGQFAKGYSGNPTGRPAPSTSAPYPADRRGVTSWR